MRPLPAVRPFAPARYLWRMAELPLLSIDTIMNANYFNARNWPRFQK